MLVGREHERENGPPSEVRRTAGNANLVFVGDSAFPLTENLQRPYCRGEMNERQMIFNYRLSRDCRVSENAFGVMSNRFRCLLSNLQLLPDTATAVVRACCLLHNLLHRKCGKGYITKAMCSTDHEAPIAACELQAIYPAVGRKPPNVSRTTSWALVRYHGRIKS